MQKILISGASVAGPVLAYWLKRYGFQPTVVERAPGLRKTGGHAVDLFRPAMDIVEKMGVLAEIEARATGTEHLTLRRDGVKRAVEVDVKRILQTVSRRHCEIMRDELAEVLIGASRGEVEYVYGDSIASLRQDDAGVDVTFERGAPRRFDLVVGADGLHSNVRRLVFGEERQFSHPIGAYLAVASIPNYLDLRDRTILVSGVDRLAGVYSARHMDDARVVFLFRSPRELEYHHRDVARQKQLLTEAFAGMGWEVPRLLEEARRAQVFYFDTITQLRMDTWTRGRVTLAGDAGYSPGAAVGGSTSLAIVGAYVLAGELAAAGGDHVRGFRNCEETLQQYVMHSRAFALSAARKLIPGSPLALWLFAQSAWLFDRVPVSWLRTLARLGRSSVQLHDAFVLKDYADVVRPAAPAAVAHA
ncbi:2-polyprenyl-6-methoxyphenol hydroxylase [Nannocystis exedens]|uniref:2-polyprenyl-6-methoxyphenol hydroxylase n=1 Tax=Nannocystis exedens TaxID=54 RepID=A0A1I2FXD3_9BACT|nr:FAD-dependent monooxygenase [Nannocystis exedens]PCC73763.1 FAD-dependent oxidoreductase [Nannocystis exedens]SFF09166.1 2-polyprenyl-6-methoxyphenol hydroxylase [Nannocystis exedens]